MTKDLKELAAGEAGNSAKNAARLAKEIEYIYIFSPLGEGKGFYSVCVG
jgi:hypothetical protein